MKPRWHILFGFIFAYILIYFFHFSVISGLIVFSASFLVDADHYLCYVFEKKDLDFFNCLDWSEKQRNKWEKLSKEEKRIYKYNIIIFHGIEFLFLVFILSFFYYFFFLIFLGIMVHLIADFFDLAYYKAPLYVKISQIYIYLKSKNKKDS